MNKTNLLPELKKKFEQFIGLDLSLLCTKGTKTLEFPNHSLNDVIFLVEDTQRLIKQLVENWKICENSTFLFLNSINSNLDAFLKQFSILSSLNPEQLTNQHHNPLKQLINITQLLRQSGTYSILTPSIDIPELENNLSDLNLKASEIVIEATEKAKIIRDLIPEATATSLSVSMENRASSIETRVYFWQVAVIVVLLISFFLSGSFLLQSSIFNDPSLNSENDTFAYWLKRVIVFLPLFYLIVFCIKQYNRERKLLEIYTHKKSIGQTLPAYIEQAISNEIKDEILLRGASMIFTLPENPDTPVQSKDTIGNSELKELINIKKSLIN